MLIPRLPLKNEPVLVNRRFFRSDCINSLIILVNIACSAYTVHSTHLI